MKAKKVLAATLGAVLEERKKPAEPLIGEWDWLGYAIGKLGGPTEAAAKLGITRQTIYTYLGEGLADAPFRDVISISNLADVPMQFLARRMGPYEESEAGRARMKSNNRKVA